MELRKKKFVNVYEVTRRYGGPEEGGWYYNWYECVKSVPVWEDEAEEVKDALYEEYGEGWGRLSEVGGMEFAVWVERELAESQSTSRSIYC